VKILIVGGGLIGQAIAWRASQRGLDVMLVNSPSVNAASRVGAGLLIPAGGRVSRHHLALKAASAEMFPETVAELDEMTGVDCGYNPCGTLSVAFEPGADNAIDGVVNCLRGLGLHVERLSGVECREREPALSDDAAAGYYNEDHQIDPDKFALALGRAGELGGVEYREGRVTRVGAREVELSDGDVLSADKVVVTTGAWLKELLSLPVYPIKGEVIHLTGSPDLIKHNLVLRKEEIYVANRGDGRFVVGATVEDVGFDTSVRGTDHLHRMAQRLVPGLKDCRLGETRVGFRPKIGDGLPLLGDYEGVVVAGGHYRSGILLTPVTAELIVEFLCTGRVVDLMKPFDPGRDWRHRDEKTTEATAPPTS
jgi:glycine oxidase